MLRCMFAALHVDKSAKAYSNHFVLVLVCKSTFWLIPMQPASLSCTASCGHWRKPTHKVTSKRVPFVHQEMISAIVDEMESWEWLDRQPVPWLVLWSLSQRRTGVVDSVLITGD